MAYSMKHTETDIAVCVMGASFLGVAITGNWSGAIIGGFLGLLIGLAHPELR